MNRIRQQLELFTGFCVSYYGTGSKYHRRQLIRPEYVCVTTTVACFSQRNLAFKHDEIPHGETSNLGVSVRHSDFCLADLCRNAALESQSNEQ